MNTMGIKLVDKRFKCWKYSNIYYSIKYSPCSSLPSVSRMLFFFVVCFTCCRFSSVARQNDTNPSVVALFLKHAACHNMTANVTLPQQKGMFSFKRKIPLHIFLISVISNPITVFAPPELCTWMKKHWGKQGNDNNYILWFYNLFMFWIMITNFFFTCPPTEWLHPAWKWGFLIFFLWHK